MLNRYQDLVSNRVQEAIRERVFPGCVVGIARAGGESLVFPFGRLTYDKGSQLVKENTMFDVASITKSIPTSSLALKLIDEGRLRLQDRLIDFVPEVCNRSRGSIKIQHLLNQTLDYEKPLSFYKNLARDEIVDAIYRMELRSEPGSQYAYSNVTSILLGWVVEHIYGETLDKLAEKYFFRPLGMTRTTFYPQEFNRDEIPPTEIDEWRGRVVQGEVHDESAYKLGMRQVRGSSHHPPDCQGPASSRHSQSEYRRVVGSAGLFSTALDLLLFLKMMLNGGTLENNYYYSPGSIEEIYKNSRVNGFHIGLGWEVCQKHTMGKYASISTFGKTGFTGCSCLCDVQHQCAIVILSNRTYPQRKDTAGIHGVRRDIADIVFENLS